MVDFRFQEISFQRKGHQARAIFLARRLENPLHTNIDKKEAVYCVTEIIVTEIERAFGFMYCIQNRSRIAFQIDGVKIRFGYIITEKPRATGVRIRVRVCVSSLTCQRHICPHTTCTTIITTPIAASQIDMMIHQTES